MELRRKKVESDLIIDVFFTNLLRGKDGLTPFIGENKHWWIGETDSGVVADSEGANTPYIGDNDNWWINGKDTGKTSVAKIPIGVIVMWSGSISDIPEGWALCAGQGRLSNGAAIPDLGGRFIVGYHPEFEDYKKTGNKGGSEKVTLEVSQMPEHRHIYTDDFRANLPEKGETWGGHIGHPEFPEVALSKEEINSEFAKGTSAGSSGAGRVYYTTNEGGGVSHENRPPYYVLAYIIKL